MSRIKVHKANNNLTNVPSYFSQLPFRTWTTHRACVSPVGIMEPRGLMRPITARVGLGRCAGKMYLYSDAWPSSTFTTDSSRKGKAKVYPVAKMMISMGSSFGVLLKMTEFSFTSLILGLINTFPVMIRPGSSSFNTGSLSWVLNKNISRESCRSTLESSLYSPWLDQSCQSWTNHIQELRNMFTTYWSLKAKETAKAFCSLSFLCWLSTFGYCYHSRDSRMLKDHKGNQE